jgi:hypothetical protein
MVHQGQARTIGATSGNYGGSSYILYMLAFQNYMSEKDEQEQGYLGGGEYKVEGQHVNSVLVGEEGEGGRRTGRRGYKGDRGLRVRSVLYKNMHGQIRLS